MITEPPSRSRAVRRPGGPDRRRGWAAGGDRRRGARRRDDRHRDDSGGVWIATGVVLGILMYGFIVLMDVAGFTAVLPLVVLPPVVLGLMAANGLINGPRGGRRRPAPAPGPLTAADLDRLDDLGGVDGERPPRR